MPLLEVKNLHTHFKTKKGTVRAVNDVSYSLEPGKTIGIVGESGSGKSVSAMSILKLLDSNGYIAEGEIYFEGRELTKLPKEEMYNIRGNAISVILVTLTLDFAGCMLTESSLSYLGFGVTYPKPTWGNMLTVANNSTTIQNFWWQWLFPALFLAVTTICINIIGDTLRDVMDPKSSQGR